MRSLRVMRLPRADSLSVRLAPISTPRSRLVWGGHPEGRADRVNCMNPQRIERARVAIQGTPGDGGGCAGRIALYGRLATDDCQIRRGVSRVAKYSGRNDHAWAKALRDSS